MCWLLDVDGIWRRSGLSQTWTFKCVSAGPATTSMHACRIWLRRVLGRGYYSRTVCTERLQRLCGSGFSAAWTPNVRVGHISQSYTLPYRAQEAANARRALEPLAVSSLKSVAVSSLRPVAMLVYHAVNCSTWKHEGRFWSVSHVKGVWMPNRT
jgi:hypothetical protein